MFCFYLTILHCHIYLALIATLYHVLYRAYTDCLYVNMHFISSSRVGMDENLKKQIYEPLHQKTNNLHMQKQRCAVIAQLISAFVFATQIVQCLFFLNLKFQASSLLLRLYSLVCVGPGLNPKLFVFPREGSNNCWSQGGHL